MHALDALGNPVRRQLLESLAQGPKSVGELAATLPISRPAVSRHLRVLSEAHLVGHTPQGRKNVFHLERAGFDAVESYLGELWDEALQRFKLVAENLESP